MKKEKIFDMLEHAEEGSMNELTDKCPDIGDEQFERMLAKSERKYKMMKRDLIGTERDNIYMDGTTVSGVKRIQRPVWMTPIATAASVVLILGTVVGSMALFGRNGRTVKGGGDTVPAVTATTTDKKGTETTVNSSATTSVNTTETQAVTTVSTSVQENIAETNVQVVGVQEAEVTTASENASQDDAFVGRLNQSYQENYQNILTKMVDEAVSSGESLYLDYILKDVTGDGTPELIIKHGHYEVDSVITVYNSDLKAIGDMFRGSYTGIYESSSGALAFATAHMGYFCASYPVYDAASDQLTIGTQNEKDYGAYGSWEDIDVLLQEEGLTAMNVVSISVDRGSVKSYYGSQTFDYPYFGIII